mmetsp:Transcript_38312/g.86936  ORF Transcript_38312/g.86936 Transcript_38312/m.86936 type:complete len:119 (-) Transcript_38312:89-445(-)
MVALASGLVPLLALCSLPAPASSRAADRWRGGGRKVSRTPKAGRKAAGRRLTEVSGPPDTKYGIFSSEVTSCWVDWTYQDGDQSAQACDGFAYIAILNVLLFYALWISSIKFLVLCTQ